MSKAPGKTDPAPQPASEPGAAPAKRYTLADIASRAGVYVTTVSPALRDHPSIPPATRAAIRAVAKELDYQRDPLLDLCDEGSFRLNPVYFDTLNGQRMTWERFSRLFGGPPRAPEGEITQRECDLARSIQEVAEEIALRIARHVHRATGERNLCLAGGVALNCVANGGCFARGRSSASGCSRPRGTRAVRCAHARSWPIPGRRTCRRS